ncbi:tai fiber protein [Escherichia coli]|nr:tai fiber protein [Escherichia coli]
MGEGAPAIGVPFFWPSAAMPNTVIDSWSSMVFLKFNGAKFSATDYPVLAKVFPSLVLPEARGDFIRIWDDGRGADNGRVLLSTQDDAFKSHSHNFDRSWGLKNFDPTAGFDVVTADVSGEIVNQPTRSTVAVGGSETRPRNVAFNYIVRAA